MKLFILANFFILLFLFGASTFTLTLLSFFFYAFLFVLNHYLVPGGSAWSGYRHALRLRGPVGWPLLGSIPDQMNALAHRKLASIAASLDAKRLMVYSLGMSTRVIISSHPETAKQILGGSSFSDRPIKQSARALMFERAIGFAPSGAYWRHLRRLAAVHMFSPKRIAGLEGLRQHVANRMVVRVEEEMKERRVVGVKEILQEGSLNNIIESVFGLGLEKEGRSDIALTLHDMVKEGYDLISRFNLEDYFPLRFLDFYGVKRKCHNLVAKVKCVMDQIVEERKRAGGFSGRSDFLSAMLALPVEDQLSDSDLVAVLWEMIFRGTDTVAILLEWVMARIALHQDIQTKAQEELVTVVGNQRHVRDSDLSNLPYLQAIVKEVLRMHPPGPLLSWARLAVHDVYVDKLFVPAGTTAMVNMWAIAHDPAIWKDPWAFKPERFIEEDVSIMGSDLRLAPFGSGRRVCPGKALGLATVQLWLARLLHQFKWIPAEPVDLSERLMLSMEMKKPLICRVVPRGGFTS
ncbi:cytochrome P450 78A5-like [Argentina anserina]|uniref:cytochrome P450 78A5-like n=1 Tax=Argentina anserina TaxID=57926 RepID=UPI002176391C|nr:cytochrome P450 78A5-like [Potentilla anserina]